LTVHFRKHGIKSAQASKACPHCDFRHLQVRRIQQALCSLNPCCSSDLDRAGADMMREEPGKMSGSDPETVCKAFH
jgi:hypothetical protein